MITSSLCERACPRNHASRALALFVSIFPSTDPPKVAIHLLPAEKSSHAATSDTLLLSTELSLAAVLWMASPWVSRKKAMRLILSFFRRILQIVDSLFKDPAFARPLQSPPLLSNLNKELSAIYSTVTTAGREGPCPQLEPLSRLGKGHSERHVLWTYFPRLSSAWHELHVSLQ